MQLWHTNDLIVYKLQLLGLSLYLFRQNHDIAFNKKKK